MDKFIFCLETRVVPWPLRQGFGTNLSPPPPPTPNRKIAMRSLPVFRGNHTKLRNCLPLSAFLSTIIATIKIYFTYQNLQSSLFTIAITITGNNPHLKTSFLITLFYFLKNNNFIESEHYITQYIKFGCENSTRYITSVFRPKRSREKKTDRPKVILPG